MTPDKTLPAGFEMSPDGTHAVLTKPIQSSPNDERSYRLVRLNNDLEVLLIHDAKADKSAAALDVHVGHLSDPDNLQGLAHYLEHLLFLGTDKYPRENEYKEFLAQHAGKSNAFTSLDHTNFHFEVGHAHLEQALDRFAQFFISPAFNESCTDREIRAVDSEFKRNLQMDGRRLFQLGKHLSGRSHPFWHFGTGNLITLKDLPTEEGINTRDELIKFYHKYYSSSIMKLAIVGREPLDELTGWAVEKFSAIRNLGITPPSYPGPPLTPKELLSMAYVKPVQDLRTLEVKFPFSDTSRHYTLQPARYINHVVGHEGTGSILSLLKRKGWASGISAANPGGGVGFEFLSFVVSLTKEGLLHCEEIIEIIFQFVKLLQQEGVVPHIWDEVTSLASTAFRFKEMMQPAEYVVDRAGAMQKGYVPEWVLSGSELIRGNNPQIVQQFINELQIDQWVGRIVTQDLAVVPGGAFTQTERWYGTQYHVTPVSPALLDRLRSGLELHPELHMPLPNEYLPKDFETHKVPTPEPLTHPTLIKHTPLTRLWHKKDDVFWVPKVNIQFKFTVPMATVNPSNLVKSMLYVALVKDTLNEETYAAQMAGLNYSLESSINGIQLSIRGYNDKAHLLLAKIVHTMRNLQVEPDRFVRIRDQIERTHRNTYLANPSQHASFHIQVIHQEKMWTFMERLDALEFITTPEEIQLFYPEMLARLHVEGLVHGNMDREQALRMSEIMEEGLGADTRPLVPSELTAMRSLLLPEGSQAVYQRDTPDPSNLNSGIEYFIQMENAPYLPPSPSPNTNNQDMNTPTTTLTRDRKTTRALTQILAQIIQEPCFHQLRTTEQLGYIVQSGVRNFGPLTGIKILVQSERDPVYIESRIESFLTTRIQTLLFKTMSLADFERQVQSLIDKKLRKDMKLREETTKYWGQITSGYYDFWQIPEEVEIMRGITLEDARRFFAEWILPGAGRAKKVSVHIRSQKLNKLTEVGVKTSEEMENKSERKDGSPVATPEEVIALKEGTLLITDVVTFKAGLELSRAPVPVIDLLRYSKL
ncbi:Insulinase (Peptidase M16) [Linnemannia schmuckeri]|uniref:Insulinase (Peptidase M16) n=1 Tax=Linnemannia schmuckeri TaxID=64567 RepID=A0A9P5VEM0_9FUNG|nr:Insulinase (Peptidase M16) [Linnemannia schmuckeri]